MAIAEVFPYSDQHNLNLDWIITKIKEFSGNQISGISCEQLDADTVKFVITYTDGSTKELTEITLPEGPEGPQGETGATGATPELSIGTVSTLPAGSDATVTITGTAEAPVINMGIPQGIQGATGAAGGITNIDGYTGAVTTGNGIAFDTSTGEISSYDFNLTDTGTIDLSTLTLPSNVNAIGGSIRYAFNADHSIGKIYGVCSVTLGSVAGNTPTYIDLGINIPRPETSYQIIVGTLARKPEGTSGFSNGFVANGSTGHLNLSFTQTSSQSGLYWMELPSCIYFFKDFGDTPDNRDMRGLEFSERMAALDPI